MPDPTPIAQTIADIAAGGVQSASGPDGRSATAMPVADLILADQYDAKRKALKPGRSPFHLLRQAKAVPPGAA